MKTTYALPIACLFFNLSIYAKENINWVSHQRPAQVLLNCSPSTSQADLDIGNVRAKLFINGDMWWDLVGNARYEVPKNSGKYSLFAGALWFGGTDVGHNLKVAAQTYRQNGSDFWPGPLDTTNTSISGAVCNQYNRHWKITRQEVSDFISNGTLTTDIQQWPGTGDPFSNQAHFLAPFVDINGDGLYNTADGDYPAFDFSASGTGGCSNCQYLHGDQSIWWVFNDMGNIHTESNGNQIGLEIHAEAFAYNSGIPNLDNATFYQYKIINRSSLSLNETYFGQWVDPDLGNYLDDYVGCDVARGMGFCYNGDADDDGPTGYGLNPPAIGLDFLTGPVADTGDGIDNDRDSCIDCTWVTDSLGQMIAIPESVLPERIIMSKFVYYNNNSDPVSGNPASALNYYNYMKGIWRNSTKMTYGGNGHGGGTGTTTDTCDFMFPGDSDPAHWGTNGHAEAVWDETTAGNAPGDRRFLQSAGPFTLQPGAVNCITTAAIWARAASGSQLASVAELKQADDQIQQFFNSCFTSFPTATNDLAISSASINIYPNPFHDYSTIHFPIGKNNQAVDVAVYNSKGKIVRMYKNIPAYDILIKRDELINGIYFYKISGNGTELKSGKLIIIE